MSLGTDAEGAAGRGASMSQPSAGATRPPAPEENVTEMSMRKVSKIKDC